MVGLCQHLAHVQGIAVVEEELQVKGGGGREMERGGEVVVERKVRGWGRGGRVFRDGGQSQGKLELVDT